MISNLIKKDFLLVKKSVAAFLGISILIPLLVIILLKNTAQIQGIGMFVFLYMVILMELSFMQSVATKRARKQRRCFAQRHIPEKAMLSQSIFATRSFTGFVLPSTRL